MFTVTFYKKKAVSLGRDELLKTVINTGKETMEEAFLVAVENGANPCILIKYTWNEKN
jgi:hypothetical protein